MHYKVTSIGLFSDIWQAHQYQLLSKLLAKQDSSLRKKIKIKVFKVFIK